MNIEHVIQRPKLLTEYVNMTTEYLHKKYPQISEEQISEWVKNIVRTNYKPKSVIYLNTKREGVIEYKTGDLYEFLCSLSSKVVSPSGSSYYPTVDKPSIISQMVIDKLAERKKIKKKMLKAKADGDMVTARNCHYQQATIKINCNSLPGGFASPYNIFYDKGGYNSITSSARCMIARAYSMAEQLLGGNFCWFNEEELINFITLQLHHRPSDDKIHHCVDRYKLKTPSQQELLKFYQDTIKVYKPKIDMSIIQDYVNKLSNEDIIFLFYYCNLRHIMWYNDTVFRKYIDHVTDTSNIVIDTNYTTDDLWKIDDTILAVTTVSFSKDFEYLSIKIITDSRPDLVSKLVSYCKVVEKRLHELDELFETFVYTDADVPYIKHKPMTWRNTTIISDTDSCIFTAYAWDKWYRGEQENIDERSYQITALAIYWLHHTVRHALLVFSHNFGVSPEHLRVLNMKNEFLYPVMLIFAIKKTYAGLITVQEGVMFKDPVPDIKGAQLRGSTICQKSHDFINNFIIHDILYPSMNGKLLAKDLIYKVVDFENNIKQEVSDGATIYFKIASLKMKSEYTNPESTSVYVAYKFWQYVFSEKYGEIQPPTKTYMIPVTEPSSIVLDNLKVKYPLIIKKIEEFMFKYNKFPNNLIINPLLNKVPEEIIPFIDIRSIVQHNVRPIYLTLERLGIAVGGVKLKLLLSDIYPHENLDF